MTTTTDMPSDAALIEAARRSGWAKPNNALSVAKERPEAVSELILAARLIEKHEPETLVDPMEKRILEEADRLSNEWNDDSPDFTTVAEFALSALKRGIEIGREGL